MQARIGQQLLDHAKDSHFSIGGKALFGPGDDQVCGNAAFFREIGDIALERWNESQVNPDLPGC